MDFSLTEDQRAFADTAAALFGDHCSDEALRAHDVGDAPFMQSAWREAVQAGLHGVIVPEEAGGLGLGQVVVACERCLLGAGPFHAGPSSAGTGWYQGTSARWP